MGSGEVARFPIRGHRRGLWARLRRVHPLCTGAVRETGPATAHRHTAAEGARHRTLRAGDRIRRQSDRKLLPAADTDHRGVPTTPQRTPAVTGWTTTADIRTRV